MDNWEFVELLRDMYRILEKILEKVEKLVPPAKPVATTLKLIPGIPQDN